MNVQLKIEEAMASTKPNTKERKRALAAIKWVLRESFGLYYGLTEIGRIKLVPKDAAVVFDGRDNEEMKIKFAEIPTGGKFTVELAQ